MIVEGNGKFNDLHCVIVGQQGVLLHKLISDIETQNFTFSITPSTEMAPLSHLYVYYIHKKGGIVQDVIPLAFKSASLQKVRD